MQFVLIAEHPDRLRPIISSTGATSEHYAVLHAGTLSDAVAIAADIDDKIPLLRIHLTYARPTPNATEIVLPPRRSSIVSLIHDASLLRIADGAVITAADDVQEDHRHLLESAAATLTNLGYHISPCPELIAKKELS